MFTALQPPEHLLTYSWLDQEEASALGVLRDLEKVKLEGKRLKPARVHASRVALRRWSSVWEILGSDGWEDSFYKQKIEGRLKKLNKALGALRDLDVNLELGKNYSLPEAVLTSWTKRRKKLTQRVTEKVAEQRPKKLIADLKMHIGRRFFTLEYELKAKAGKTQEDSAFEHMGAFLEMTEKSAWLLALEAKSDEELHELRLFIKRWRYILAEFFGLTTLDLVKAQQLLGKHHDLTRLLHQLNLEVERLGTQKCHGADQARSRISLELAKVLDDIKPVIANLPYGLRPHTVSIEPEQ